MEYGVNVKIVNVVVAEEEKQTTDVVAVAKDQHAKGNDNCGGRKRSTRKRKRQIWKCHNLRNQQQQPVRPGLSFIHFSHFGVLWDGLNRTSCVSHNDVDISSSNRGGSAGRGKSPSTSNETSNEIDHSGCG
jgi:hypothetical protein